jgi:hypothetical protein
LLHHRLADALRHATVGLAVNNQRVDGAANVVNAGVLHDLPSSEIRIDLDLPDVAAVGETRIVHGLIAYSGQRPAQLIWQIGALGHRGCNLAKRHRTTALFGAQASLMEFDCLGPCLHEAVPRRVWPSR